MAAFAGRFGMTLDLDLFPGECAGGGLRDDQILFSESCGRFLVTVSPTVARLLKLVSRVCPVPAWAR